MPTTPTSDRCSPICAWRWVSIPTRSLPTHARATPRRSSRHAATGRPPAGGPEMAAAAPLHPAVEALLARSNRLGSDPRNTNYAGGNTSAKAEDLDPVTGEPVPLMWVKGSGGDLGTLTASGL